MTDILGKGSKGRVLVTGATGFIASHTLLALARAGYTVRGTARSASKAEALNRTLSAYAGQPVEIELVSADLTSDTGWDAAVADCQFVMHMASPIPSVLPKDPLELINPARDGALRVLKASKAASVRRVVMTSSFAAVGYGWGDARPDLLTEEHWSNPDNLKDNTAYTRSKTIAERAAWEYVNGEGEGLELSTINPVAVLGPAMSADVSASLELITQPMQKKLPAIPKLSFGVVDVRDVADAHVAAMTHPGAAGERFLVSESVLWFRDIVAILNEAYPERKLPTKELPSWLVRVLSNMNPVLKQIVPELGKFRNVSSEKARRVLGWQPRSAGDAVLSSAKTLVDLGAL